MKKQNEKTESINREGYMAKTFAICGFALLFALCAFLAASQWNPDSDAYWLIETGRWIWENKGVPKINPWVQTENLSVIVQQPLCALFNYLTYYISGSLTHMWILAMIQNAVMLACLALLGKTIFNKLCPVKENDQVHNRIVTTQIFSTLIIAEALCASCNLITTRPYQITIATSALLLCALEKHTQSENYARLGLRVALLTLWQANFQMASLIFIPFFLFLYMVGNAVEKLKRHELLKQVNLLKWIAIYVIWGLISLINPYGLKGTLYLFHSGNAVSLFKDSISELQSPVMCSLFGFIIMGTLLLIVSLVKDKELKMQHYFLFGSSVILTGYAARNGWMCVLTFTLFFFIYKAKHMESTPSPFIEKLKQFYRAVVCSLPSRFAFLMVEKKEINEDKKSTKVFEKILCVICFGLSMLIIASSEYAPNELLSETQEYIDLISELPEDAKIYTDFNTGGIVEFCQRKCYVDARPELYSPEITESDVNLIGEYENFDFHEHDNYEEITKDFDYDYYFVRKNSLFQYFLMYGHHAEMVHESDNYVLYGNIIQ